MIQPNKGISPERALLTVGAQVLQQLDQPKTVSAVWHSLKESRRKAGYRANISYWWFILALDTLHALGVLHYEDGLLVKRSVNVASAV
jgi:hypothetical protein